MIYLNYSQLIAHINVTNADASRVGKRNSMLYIVCAAVQIIVEILLLEEDQIESEIYTD